MSHFPGNGRPGYAGRSYSQPLIPTQAVNGGVVSGGGSRIGNGGSQINSSGSGSSIYDYEFVNGIYVKRGTASTTAPNDYGAQNGAGVPPTKLSTSLSTSGVISSARSTDEQLLEQLAAMGFNDVGLNCQLLSENQGNLQAVVDILLSGRFSASSISKSTSLPNTSSVAPSYNPYPQQLQQQQYYQQQQQQQYAAYYQQQQQQQANYGYYPTMEYQAAPVVQPVQPAYVAPVLSRTAALPPMPALAAAHPPIPSVPVAPIGDSCCLPEPCCHPPAPTPAPSYVVTLPPPPAGMIPDIKPSIAPTPHVPIFAPGMMSQPNPPTGPPVHAHVKASAHPPAPSAPSAKLGFRSVGARPGAPPLTGAVSGNARSANTHCPGPCHHGQTTSQPTTQTTSQTTSQTTTQSSPATESGFVSLNSSGSTPRQAYSWRKRVSAFVEKANAQESNREMAQSFESLKLGIHYLQKVLQKHGAEMSNTERQDAIQTITQLINKAKAIDPENQARQGPTVVRRNPTPVNSNSTNNNSSLRPSSHPQQPQPQKPPAATQKPPQSEVQSRYPRISHYDSLKFNVIRVDEQQFKNALSKLGPSPTPGRPNAVQSTQLGSTSAPSLSSPASTLSPSPSAPGMSSGKGDSPLAGKVVDVSHSNWWITMALLSGMHYGLSRTSMAEVEIAQVDAENFEEIKSVELTKDPSLFPAPFDFINHAPLVFREIRKLCGIQTRDYLDSLKNSLCELKSPGKSDSLFYFSYNRQYIIKTVNEEEFQCFKGYLLCYYGHLKQFPESLLIRFLSLHSIRTAEKAMHFVVMENISPPNKFVFECYDLKGSSVGRRATDAERQKQNAILKDLDFNRRLFLGPEKRKIFFEQIEKDSAFLAEHNVMDYSLLLCIHDLNKPAPPITGASPSEPLQPPPSSYRPSKLRDYQGGIRATDLKDAPMSEVYYLGIIDIMQPYNWRKQVESSLKSFLDDPEEISCVEPNKYSSRFLKFLQKKAGMA